jgi:hypothetical protein
MLDHKRNVVRSDLESGGRSPKTAVGVVAEAGIEETRVVGAQLATRRIVGGHLGGERGWHGD